MTFGDLRTALDDLAGLDLDDAQRDDLLNEGHREICARAEWLRGEVDLGPSVAETRAYAIPENVYRILSLQVNGYDYAGSDRDEVANLTRAWGYLNTNGLWWWHYTDTGERQVGLYPTPGEDGLTISALCLLRPPLMTDDADEPVIPPEFHRAIADYAAGIAFASVEDNLDNRAYYTDRVDQKVAELRRLTFATGRGTVFMAGSNVRL